MNEGECCIITVEHARQINSRFFRGAGVSRASKIWLKQRLLDYKSTLHHGLTLPSSLNLRLSDAKHAYPFFYSLTRPHCEFTILTTCPNLKKDVDYVEGEQRLAILKKDINYLPCVQRLRKVGLHFSENRRPADT